jgi:beta-phosphoglucomutase-like phosphatase (HAD superfamily)
MTGTADRSPVGVQVVLCDADGPLFPAAEPALAASVGVANRLLGALGSARRFTADELRPAGAGLDFRATARRLAAQHGVLLLDLERWVEEERTVVTAHLTRALRPDPEVRAALTRLAERYPLAAVSSAAPSRVDGCFTAAGLDDLIGPAVRFCAADRVPAVHRHACDRLGIPAGAGLAVEDSPAGVAAAVAAGCPAVGNLAFVPPDQRPERAAALRAAGATAVVPSWSRLADLLLSPAPARIGAAR